MQRGSTLIIVLLIASLGWGMSISLFTQAEITQIAKGDCYTYMGTLEDNYIVNSSVFVENKNYATETFWEQNSENQTYYKEMSLTADNILVDDVGSNVTENTYKSTTLTTKEKYNYDYDNDVWVLQTSEQNTFTNPQNVGGYSYRYFNHYPDQLLLDISDSGRFLDTTYEKSAVKEYEINGISQDLNVSIYKLEETSSSLYSSHTFHDLTMNIYLNVTKEIVYVIEQITNILLEYKEYIVSSYIGQLTDFSSELNSTVHLFELESFVTKIDWEISEINAATYPSNDADLPYINNWYFPQIENASFYSFSLEIMDSSNDVSMELYINDALLGTWTNLENGVHNFSVLTADIPYNGPYSVGIQTKLEAVLTDSYAHNTTLFLVLEDQRIRTPHWPLYINAPDYLEFYEGDNVYISFDIFADTNWTVQVSILPSDTLLYEGVGYLNTTYPILAEAGTLAVGNYTFRIDIADSWTLYTWYVNVVVLHVPTDIAPEIKGDMVGKGDYYYYAGDPDYFTYTLFDDDPTVFYVYVNGTTFMTDTYYNGMDIVIHLDSFATVVNATYELKIEALDASGHITTESIYIHVLEGLQQTDTTSTPTDTTNTGQNTLSLDSPNLFIIFTSVFSLSAIIILRKKKK